jgi:hypothetical protein
MQHRTTRGVSNSDLVADGQKACVRAEIRLGSRLSTWVNRRQLLMGAGGAWVQEEQVACAGAARREGAAAAAALTYGVAWAAGESGS